MIDVMGHFQLTSMPFSKGIPSRDLLQTETFKEASARLSYAVGNRCFALLTAPPGCGKSTLLRHMADSLDPRTHLVIYIAESKLTPRWLYNKMLEHFGAKGYLYRGDARKAVYELLAVQHEVKHKEIVCVIDEAHLLSRETLEETRFFLNTDMDSSTPLSLVLSGQSELLGRLRRPEMEAIRQRVETECRLLPLSEALVPGYIRAHLTSCGCQEEVFSPDAVSEVFRYSRGVPRMINRACMAGLTYATSRAARRVSGLEMKEIIDKELS